MTTFARAGFKSVNYNSFRPHYPPSFYKILQEYIGEKRIKRAIDLGCGSGVATYPLLEFSDHVVGLDLSPAMIKTAKALKPEKLAKLNLQNDDCIEFQVGSVESFEAPASSYDLITAAECIHWFSDYSSFFASAYRQLKPNGVLAYWYYVDPIIIDFTGPHDLTKSAAELLQGAADIYHRIVYNDPKLLGSHWEQPGREILKNSLNSVDTSIPTDLFTDIKIKKYQPVLTGNNVLTADDLILTREGITIVDFVNYISTYSLYHSYNEATNQGHALLELFLESFEKELGWSRTETFLKVNWASGYTFMRKI